MLRPGDTVPDFTITTLDRRAVSYASIWQCKNLLFVSLPNEDTAAVSTYVAELSACINELSAHDTECVFTKDVVESIPSPGIMVADRWGEIYHVVAATTVDDLPHALELIEWLRYVQVQCPECQGETR